MAKKSVIQREKKREILVNRFNNLRSLLKKKIKIERSFQKKLELYVQLQKLPKNSSSSRLI